MNYNDFLPKLNNLELSDSSRTKVLGTSKELKLFYDTHVAVNDVFPTGEPICTFSSTSRVYSLLANTGGLSLMSPM